MSTMLRSLKYLKRLTVGSSGRRLGSSFHRVANDSLLKSNSWTRCSANTSTDRCSRNYVTRIATQQNTNVDDFNKLKDVDSILNDVDKRIKTFGSINREDVEEIMNAIIRKGTLTSIQALLLIRCCGNFLSSENLKTRKSLTQSAWELINESDIQLDVSHYNSLLLVNLENDSDFSPLDILVEMKEKNIEPNRVTFQRLIEQYCNKGDIAGATKILEHMSEKGIPINENVFSSLIKGHSLAGDSESAINTLKIMKEAGIEPSSRTYVAILSTHAKDGNIEAIQNVFSECKKKDIPFSDKEILEVIFTLAVNEHHDLIDEIVTALPKGSSYNKDIISCIYRLIEKNQIEVAYKLFKIMKKPTRNDEEYLEYGRFFIKKLVTADVDADTIAKYCQKMMEEKFNNTPFQFALQIAFSNNMHHIALSLLKAHKASGGEIRELFFYPIFVSFGKSNNLQGILNTLKSMTYDFEIKPSIYLLKEYIIPYMIDDEVSNSVTLINNNLQFSSVVNAMILYLLEVEKIQQAAKFMYTTNLTFRTNLLTRPLVNAFIKTKDFKSLNKIIHFQYMQLLGQNLSSSGLEDENSEEQVTAKQFINQVVKQIVNRLPQYSSDVLINVLNGLLETGISIEKETADTVKSFLGSEKLTPQVVSTLNKLSSGDLEPLPLNRDKIRGSIFNNLGSNNLVNKTLDESIEMTPELKMAMIAQHARNSNHDEVEKMLKELEELHPKYTVGFCATMIDYNSKTDKIDEADKWFSRLSEIDPNNKIDMSKILNYASALVRANRVSDALKILNHPILDQDSDRNVLCQKLLKTVSMCCPDQVQEFFDVLENNKFFKVATSQIVGFLVKAPLDEGNIEKAIEKFQYAGEKFKLTPLKISLMMKLIAQEDAKNLQRVTDLCTKVHGEINALYDLSIAFLESDRLRQARKILETPGVRLRRGSVLNTAERYKDKDQVQLLENFIHLLTGLFMDMNPLYLILLEVYEKKGSWEKCLSLWTQMQEDNIQPSAEFMNYLEKILVNHGQEVPFAKSADMEKSNESASNQTTFDFKAALLSGNFAEAEKLLKQIPLQDRNRSLIQLAEFYVVENKFKEAESKIDLLNITESVDSYIQESTKNMLTKLAENDEFSTIYKLIRKVNENGKNIKDLLACRVLNDRYYENGNFEKLLSHIEEILDDPNRENTIINSFFHSVVAALASYKQPQVEERLKKLALKAFDTNITSPINAYWISKFIQDSPEADDVFNKYLSNNSRFQIMSALNVIKTLKLYEKLPQLTEKIMQHKTLNYEVKRRGLVSIISAILDSDDPKKYDVAYECIRISSKVIPVARLNQEKISEIEKNLSGGKTLQSLTEESEREKATG